MLSGKTSRDNGDAFQSLCSTIVLHWKTASVLSCKLGTEFLVRWLKNGRGWARRKGGADSLYGE